MMGEVVSHERISVPLATFATSVTGHLLFTPLGAFLVHTIHNRYKKSYARHDSIL
jgi:hypothetical protein